MAGIKNIEDAIDNFVKFSSENVKLFGKEEHKLSNKYYKLIKSSYDFLEKNNSIDKLFPLFQHPDYGVQLWVASFIGKYYKDEAKEVLNKIISLKIPHISLSAEYTLKDIDENIR